MIIRGDYHTHTLYSHGKSTIRENVERALEIGLEEIAICDHGPGHVFYGVRKKNLFKMKREIDKLNDEYKDINILMGMEANIISYDGEIDVDDEIVEILDILFVGYHYGIVPRGLKSIFKFYIENSLSKIIKPLEKNIIKDNTDAVIKAINKYPIKLITHPGSKARLDIERLARECEKLDVCLEINSSHSQLDCESIKEAMKTDVEFMINSDAHSRDRIGDFSKGIERAKEVGLDPERIKNAKK